MNGNLLTLKDVTSARASRFFTEMTEQLRPCQTFRVNEDGMDA